MTAVPVKTSLTAEEFLALPDEWNYELVDGELLERKQMGGYSSGVASRVSHLLQTFNDAHKLGFTVDSSATYRCFASPKTLRRPDISFIRYGRLPGGELPQGFITVPPDLAVEVISPNDLADEVAEKIQEYLAAAFPLVWVIYPRARTVHVYRPGHPTVMLTENDNITGDPIIPGFACPVREFFSL